MKYLLTPSWILGFCLLVTSHLSAQTSVQDSSVVCQAACDPNCCATDPTPSGLMYTRLHKKGQWMFSYRYMYMQMGEMQDGSSAISDEEVLSTYLMSANKMQMQMHMLMAMYGLTDKLTMMAMLNFNMNQMDMVMLPGTGHSHSHSHGGHGHEADSNMVSYAALGDTRLAAMYGFINNEKHQLSAVLGLSLPTGTIKAKGGHGQMYDGERLPYMMQTSTGTWDLQPGVNYNLRFGKAMFGAQALATIRTGYNMAGYRYGNEFLLNSWLAYSWLNWISTSVRLEGAAVGEMSGSDAQIYAWNEPGTNPMNFGGSRVSALLGVNTHLNRTGAVGHKIGVEFGLPLYQYFVGIQQKQQFGINGMYTISF